MHSDKGISCPQFEDNYENGSELTRPNRFANKNNGPEILPKPLSIIYLCFFMLEKTDSAENNGKIKRNAVHLGQCHSIGKLGTEIFSAILVYTDNIIKVYINLQVFDFFHDSFRNFFAIPAPI